MKRPADPSSAAKKISTSAFYYRRRTTASSLNNTRLVCHLPLVIPDGCWFRVGAQTRPWRMGEAFVFDDTIEHEASNPSDQLRVVLILDLWHPGLSPVEREAVTRLLEVETTDGGL